MSGHGKEVIGPMAEPRKHICIDCGGSTTRICTDWGAGNGRDGPLCSDCYVKRRNR